MKVAYTNCKGYDQAEVDAAVAEVLSSLGGIESLVPKEAKVFVKANLVRDMAPEQAGTTHPAVLTAVAKQLIDKCGASVVIGDSSGGAYTKGYMNTVYAKCGLVPVAEQTGATLNQDFSFANVDMGGVKIKNMDVISAFLDADVVVNVTKLKTHSFAGYTGAVKNLYGLIPGLVKVQVHSRFPDLGDFCDALVDIEQFASKKIVLHVIDAVIGMEGAGPTNGKPRFIGKIFASQNPYLLDVAAVSLFDDPFNMPLLMKAVERGVLKRDLSDMECDLEALKKDFIADYDKVEAVAGSTFFVNFVHLPKFVEKLLAKNLSPRVSMTKKCRACGKCKTHCPAQAIEIKNKRARVDQKKCIHCFCCQELCPFDAVKLKKPLLYKVTRRLSRSKAQKANNS